MTHIEVTHALVDLPNIGDDMGGMPDTDRRWLTDFRIRFAEGQVPTVQDIETLRRLVREWSE